jgi:hypothetical protein
MLNVHKDSAEKEPLQIVGIWFSYLILSKQEAEKHESCISRPDNTFFMFAIKVQ